MVEDFGVAFEGGDLFGFGHFCGIFNWIAHELFRDYKVIKRIKVDLKRMRWSEKVLSKNRIINFKLASYGY